MWSLSQDLKYALLSIFPAISFNKRYGIIKKRSENYLNLTSQLVQSASLTMDHV